MLKYTPAQKAFLLMMAAWVLIFAVFIPINGKASPEKASSSQLTITDASFQEAPDLSPGPSSGLKLSIPFLALCRVWCISTSFTSPKIQEYQLLFFSFFLQKINFVFTSAKAP